MEVTWLREVSAPLAPLVTSFTSPDIQRTILKNKLSFGNQNFISGLRKKAKYNRSFAVEYFLLPYFNLGTGMLPRNLFPLNAAIHFKNPSGSIFTTGLFHISSGDFRSKISCMSLRKNIDGCTSSIISRL